MWREWETEGLPKSLIWTTCLASMKFHDLPIKGGQ